MADPIRNRYRGYGSRAALIDKSTRGAFMNDGAQDRP
jgi:hypothetical protein